jgi:WD40 repeat protein
MPDKTAPELFVRIEAGSHAGVIDNMLATSDGRLLVTGGKDKTIRIWRTDRRRLARTLLWQIGPGRIGELSRMLIDPEDRRVYFTTRIVEGGDWNEKHLRCALRVFDLESGNQIISHADLGWISAMRFVAGGAGLLTVDHLSRVIRLFDTAALLAGKNPAPLITSGALPGEPRRLAAWTAGGNVRAAVGATGPGGGLSLCEIAESGVNTLTSIGLPEGDGPANLVASGERIAVTGVNSWILSIFDLQLNPIGKPLKLQDPPSGLAFVDDTTLLVGTNSDKPGSKARVFDVRDTPVETCAYAGHGGAARAVACLPDGTAVSAGGPRNDIHFWRPKGPDGELVGSIASVGRTIYAVGISAERKVALGFEPAAPDDAGAPAPLQVVVDLDDLGVARLPPLPIFGRARASRDGERLSLRTDRGSNLFLEPIDQPITGTAEEPWYFAATYGFTPAGSIVTGDRDGAVRRARVANGIAQLPGRFLRGHQAQVCDHAANADWLVTGGYDQIARLWYMPDVEAGVETPLRPALNLFVAADGEWVIWSENNFYDASDGGDRYLAFHANQGDDQEAQCVCADRCVSLLYRPGVIRAILQTGSEDRALARLGMQLPDLAGNLPPVVECHDPRVIRTGAPYVDLNIEVRPARGQNIRRFWVLQNDHIAYEDRTVGSETRSYPALRLALEPGENRFKLLAEGDGAKSPPILMTVNPDRETESLAPPEGGYGGGGGGDAGSAPGPAIEPSLKPAESEPLPASGGGPLEASPIRPLSVSVAFKVPAGTDRKIPVSAMRNGKRVRSAVTRRKDIITVRVPVPEGHHEISISAGARKLARPVFAASVETGRLAEGTVEARPAPPAAPAPASVLVPAPDATPAARPNLYVLTVGVSLLKTPTASYPNLRFATNDAMAVRQALETQRGVVFDEVMTWELLNENATLENVRKALAELESAVRARGRRTGPDGTTIRDVTVIFLAGHGVQTTDSEFYFLTHEFDFANRKETGLSFIELGDSVTAFPTELFILIDACHSSMAGASALSGLRPEELFKRLSALNERAQTIFSASQKGELALEDPSLGHGLFTNGILKTLATAPPNVDISVLELIDRTMKKVLEWSSRQQQPSFRVYGDQSRWVVYRRTDPPPLASAAQAAASGPIFRG